VINLAVIRHAAGVHQVPLAQKLGITQGAISKAEKQEDWLVSTLTSYLTALGAEAELVVTVNGETITQPLTKKKGKKR
jgi:transcriptional regulator with XRE-family HTH domain